MASPSKVYHATASKTNNDPGRSVASQIRAYFELVISIQRFESDVYQVDFFFIGTHVRVPFNVLLHILLPRPLDVRWHNGFCLKWGPIQVLTPPDGLKLQSRLPPGAILGYNLQLYSLFGICSVAAVVSCCSILSSGVQSALL